MNHNQSKVNLFKWLFLIVNWTGWIVMFIATVVGIKNNNALMLAQASWIFCGLLFWEIIRGKKK